MAGCKDNRAPRGGDDDGSSAVAQINTSERKSVRLPRIKRTQEPRIAQGQRIPVRDLLKIAAHPGNRDSKINKPIEQSDFPALGTSAADHRLFQGEVASSLHH